MKMRQDYDIFAALNLRKYLKDEKIEILHSHHSKSHSIGLLATYGLENIKFVATRRVIFRLRKNIFSRFKYKTKRVDKYIAVSEAIKRNLVDYGIEDKRVAVIYSATDIGKFNPDGKSKIREEFKIPGTAFVGCLIGNYSYYKGHTFFLEAIPEVLRRFPDMKILVVGNVSKELLELSKNLKIENNVFFLGFRSDIPEIMRASNFLVCPSLQEGLAGVIREAMAVGLPVIATRVGGNPEIVKDNETGILIEPKNSNAIANAIVSLMGKAGDAQRMGKKGREFVMEKFLVDSMVLKHEKLYMGLLNEQI
jgi:glycosyltransferase involved in cell wall biosynthesis